jgi:hypothetical protein
VIPFAMRRLPAEDLARLCQFWNEQWSGGFIVTRGTIHKPGIPLIGENRIPLRDEIELELIV